MKTINYNGIDLPITDELEKALEKAKKEKEKLSLSWKPEKYETCFTVGADGRVLMFVHDSSFSKRVLSMHDAYQTEEIAEMAKHRRRLHNTPSTAKKGSNFWVWDYSTSAPTRNNAYFYYDYIDRPRFQTKEEAEKWGKGDGEDKGAQEVYEFFYNLTE